MYPRLKPARVALTVIALLLLTACQGGTGSSSSAAPSGSTPESATIQRIQEAGVLKVGAAIAMPTLGKDPETNEYIGAGTLIAEELADRLGVTVQYLDQDWSIIPAGIQSGTIDISVAGLWVTEERLTALGMTPWWQAGFCYFALKDNNKVGAAADINDPDVVVATFEGSGTYQSVSKAYPDATYVTRPEIPGEYSAITELLAHEADIAPIDSTMVNVFLERYDQLKVIPADCATNPDIPAWVGVAYTKDDSAFKAYMDSMIDEMQPELKAALAEFLKSEWMSIGL
jgi:polar amino acid transport system substrate-binding protein